MGVNEKVLSFLQSLYDGTSSKWCRDWGVKINVSKSGIMQVRQKRVATMDVQYVVDNEDIPMVEQYSYLGSVVKNIWS